MALEDLSFKLYTDSDLITEYSGISQFTHQTDLSDNPQDILLYFGSTNATRQLEASNNPGVDNITIEPTDTLPEWVTVTAYALDDQVEPTVDNTYVYKCTTAGTAAVSEPTWPTVIGSTVVDGTVVWTCYAKNHPTTEVKLATTLIGLDTATGGAALSLGTVISGGSVNAAEIHIRVTNTVTTPSTTVDNHHIGIYIPVTNPVLETAP